MSHIPVKSSRACGIFYSSFESASHYISKQQPAMCDRKKEKNFITANMHSQIQFKQHFFCPQPQLNEGLLSATCLV